MSDMRILDSEKSFETVPLGHCLLAIMHILPQVPKQTKVFGDLKKSAHKTRKTNDFWKCRKVPLSVISNVLYRFPLSYIILH